MAGVHPEEVTVQAIIITKDDAGYRTSFGEVDEQELPDGDVTVAVEYSTLNYKDSLAITGSSPVVRSFPMVPGVDFAGSVEASSHPDFAVGDAVVLNGWGVGEVRWGGYAEKARVNGDWLVPLPTAFTTKQAMVIGTAGYTAALCLLALERHGVTPDRGDVLVTGAAGGVGGMAVALLAKNGYRVVASTGRTELDEYLRGLGAAEVIDRTDLSEPGRPLGKERWAGAIDAVGSHTLANVCATTQYGGTVAACGLAQGFDLPVTVMPFILRGVTLAGVDSVYCPNPQRRAAWERLARDLDGAHIDMMATEITLRDVIAEAPRQLAGETRGRVVVAVNS